VNAAVILLALWLDFIVIPGAIAGTIYGVVRAAGSGKRNRRARVAQMNAEAWHRATLGHRAY